MVSDGERKKIMSLSDGIKVETYEDLIKEQLTGLLFEPVGDRIFTYTDIYNCPGLTNIQTGERYFSNDIKRYIQFPLHYVYLVPFIEENKNASQRDGD